VIRKNIKETSKGTREEITSSDGEENRRKQQHPTVQRAAKALSDIRGGRKDKTFLLKKTVP